MAFPRISLAFYVLVLAVTALARTVIYDWQVTFIHNANPDGRYPRTVIGINGQWPCPKIEVEVGDRLVVNVLNKLPDQYTSLHFHGLHQRGTAAMDGPPSTTQCQIPPGGAFTYDFEIRQSGTFWYHSHTDGQYGDGLRGPLIIHDPRSPYRNDYHQELVLSVTDWYHQPMPVLLPYYLSRKLNPSGAEPIPYSALFNEAQNITLDVKPGQRYFLRIISMAVFSQAFIHFDKHKMTIIEVDGVYTEKKEVDTLYLAVGQRYGVILETKKNGTENYAFLGSLDTSAYDKVPSYLNPIVTGHLQYHKDKPRAQKAPHLNSTKVFDDFTLKPYDRFEILGEPSQTIVLGLNFSVQRGRNLAQFNSISYTPQRVPTLYTAMSVGRYAQNIEVYGTRVNPFVLKYGEIVDVVINNYDSGSHPLHIHGHAPQLIARESNTHTRKLTGYPETPMRRDVVMIAGGGHTVWRFRADNPGVWLIHCHMAWHVAAGLTATLIEAPLRLQKEQKIPRAAIENCKRQGLPYRGNAAGNWKKPLNLMGIHEAPSLNQSGAEVPITEPPSGHKNGLGIFAKVEEKISTTLQNYVG